jgi:hypothetical protein
MRLLRSSILIQIDAASHRDCRATVFDPAPPIRGSQCDFSLAPESAATSLTTGTYGPAAFTGFTLTNTSNGNNVSVATAIPGAFEDQNFLAGATSAAV